MARGTPAEIAEKWGRRTAAAAEDYTKGVSSVTESPTAAAAKQLQKAATNYQQAVSSGRMKKRLEAVSLESWRESTLTKGGARFAAGAQAAVPKMDGFMKEFLPFQDTVVSEVKKMPSTSLEDSINRAAAYMRGVSKFRSGK